MLGFSITYHRYPLVRASLRWYLELLASWSYDASATEAPGPTCAPWRERVIGRLPVAMCAAPPRPRDDGVPRRAPDEVPAGALGRRSRRWAGESGGEEGWTGEMTGLGGGCSKDTLEPLALGVGELDPSRGRFFSETLRVLRGIDSGVS